MNVDDAAQRMAIMRRLTRSMRSPATAHDLNVRDTNRARRFVICLPHDTVGDTERRVREAGGQASVILPRGDELLHILWYSFNFASSRDVELIAAHSTMGMLAELLHVEGTVSFRVAERLQVETFDEGSVLSPA